MESRLASHSRGCVDLLRTAAMVGREFELDALCRIVGKPFTPEIAKAL